MSNGRAFIVPVKIYGWLLLAYPPSFRQKFGAEMKRLFLDQCRDASRQGGAWTLAGLWLRVLLDLARTSVLENISELNQRPASMRVFGLVLAGAFLGSVLLAYFSPRKFSSMVRIEVSKTLPDPDDQSRRIFSGSDPDFLTTQFKIIESYEVLTNVIDDLGLDEKLARQNGFKRWTVDQTFDYLSKRISVKQTRMTSLFEITVKNPDPTLAADIANGIASAYKMKRLQIYKMGILQADRENDGGVQSERTFIAPVIVRDPARPERKSGSRDTWTILPAWAFGAALLMWGVFFRLLPKPVHY